MVKKIYQNQKIYKKKKSKEISEKEKDIIINSGLKNKNKIKYTKKINEISDGEKRIKDLKSISTWERKKNEIDLNFIGDYNIKNELKKDLKSKGHLEIKNSINRKIENITNKCKQIWNHLIILILLVIITKFVKQSKNNILFVFKFGANNLSVKYGKNENKNLLNRRGSTKDNNLSKIDYLRKDIQIKLINNNYPHSINPKIPVKDLYYNNNNKNETRRNMLYNFLNIENYESGRYGNLNSDLYKNINIKIKRNIVLWIIIIFGIINNFLKYKFWIKEKKHFMFGRVLSGKQNIEINNSFEIKMESKKNQKEISKNEKINNKKIMWRLNSIEIIIFLMIINLFIHKTMSKNSNLFENNFSKITLKIKGD